MIGSGTVLDSARLKDEISRHLSVDARNVHTMIIGEHGDSEVPVWSNTNISGIPLSEFCEIRGHVGDHQAAMEKLYFDVRDSAYHIIEKKGATYYGIAMAVKGSQKPSSRMNILYFLFQLHFMVSTDCLMYICRSLRL